LTAGDWGRARRLRGGNDPNCILEFPQTHINARFLSPIDNFGLPLDDRYLEFNRLHQKKGQTSKIRLWMPSLSAYGEWQSLDMEKDEKKRAPCL